MTYRDLTRGIYKGYTRRYKDFVSY